MDAKSKLHSYCKKRGLNLHFQSERTDECIFKSRVVVDTFDFSGVGEAPTKKAAEKNASQNFFDRLEATDNCQGDNSGADGASAKVIVSKHQASSKRDANLAITNAKSYLTHWCRVNRVTAAYDYSFEGVSYSRLFICSMKLESSSGDLIYQGKATARAKKVANHLVAKRAVKYLLTKNLIEPHQVKHIDLSLPEDETKTHSTCQFKSTTFYNRLSVTNVPKSPPTDFSLPKDEIEIQSAPHSYPRSPHTVHSITSVQESVNTSPPKVRSLTGNWSLDTARERLIQFLKENNINADFDYSTDCHNLGGYHVARMRIKAIWVGRIFSGIGNDSSREVAAKKCAFSLVKQLYRANLIEAYSDTPKKDESISTSEKQIDLHVSDDIVADLIELCAEFGEEIPNMIGNIDGTRSLLLSAHQCSSDSEDFTSINDCVQPKYGVARMNWNPWTSTAIEKNEYNYNVSLRDVSTNMKTANELKASSVAFKAMQRNRQNLPIFQYKEEILNCIADNPVIIVKGNTGCGKSTQVCQYILDEAIATNIGSRCNVVVIEAHRICATSLASCVARQRSELSLGQSVGYSVRFDSCLPHPHGAILFCTAGSFIRKLEHGLTGISHIIVDEIHERNLETDYILIILRCMLSNNPTLKVILLSANIDTDLFASYFGGCPQVSVVAETHPVQAYFLEDCIEMVNFKVEESQYKSNFELDSDDEVLCSSEKSLENLNITESQLKTEAVVEKQHLCFELIEATILWIREQQLEGSILVFLPGRSDVKDALKYFQKPKFSDDFCFLALHSKQSNEELTEVFMPVADRLTKVILSTSIAESAVAIDGVVCVIDSCKTSFLRSQNDSGSKFMTEWTSKVNLDQRLSVAGRKKPGYCFRLCTRTRYEKLSAIMEPEIFRLPLYNVALSIKHLKLGSIAEQLNNAIQPPKPEAVKDAERFLIEMKCLDNYQELTPLGSILARLPLDLRLGKMVVTSILFSCTDHILKLAARTATHGEFSTENPSEDISYVANERFSDHIAELYALSMRKQAESSQMSSDSRNEILKIEKQLYSILENSGFDLTSIYYSENKNFDIVSALLCRGFYPDICIRDNKRKIHFIDGKFGVVSRKTLMNVKDRNFKPPSPIFVYSERNKTQINVCRNLTMVMPMHLLCFTNCKVAIDGGMVKIDDWLTLRMDLDLAALLMTVRSMIDRALLEVAEDPTRLNKAKFITLRNVVIRLCMMYPYNRATSALSSYDAQGNFHRRPDQRERIFDGPKNHNNRCKPMWPAGHLLNSGCDGRRGRGRGRGNFRHAYIKPF